MDSRLKNERRSAGELPLYHAAYFLCLAGRAERAKEYADKLLKASPQSYWALTVRGWIELRLLQDVVCFLSVVSIVKPEVTDVSMNSVSFLSLER